MADADIDRLEATAAKLRQDVEGTMTNWPTPRPIDVELPSAPRFDADALLPDVLKEFVLDEAWRMPCPPDYIAAPLLVAMGSVIGARAALKPKRHDDWIVTPNLYGGVVGEPSSKKTPGISAALRFVEGLEAREADRHAQGMKVHEAELAAFQARQQAIQAGMKSAAKGGKGTARLDEGVSALLAMQAPEPPKRRRFKTNDATVAKLGDVLSENPAGILVYRDELIGLLSSWDQEGHEQDRAFYLEGFNGTGSFNIDRVGRGSQYIRSLCISVFGGIQPELLERYLARMVTSLDNDGRFQRFQVLVYPDPVPWEWRDRKPSATARDAVRSVFDRLASFDPVEDGARAADEFVKVPAFSFDEPAQEIFVDWSEMLHLRIQAEGNPLMRQHLAKYERLFCAVALILHLASGLIGPVGREAALYAMAWCAYLEGHARRIYALVETGNVKAAKALARRMKERKLPMDGFTVRDVVRKGWVGLRNTAEAESALAVMEDHGWVLADDSVSGVGRPTTRYYTNPRIEEVQP